MAKKIKAFNKETGEQWVSSGRIKQYLVMYDSGYLGVVTEDFYAYIVPLDPKKWRWEVKI
jgi:hypothetical protein